ncbi:TPA: glycosyl transferase family 1 [Candidatus Saccharibacteria bacterium]|nr:MAG: Glycosyl transferase, group 1 [Candidatus Saccharibacteria bacterium GW2011_GWA2_46_10]OGL36390.1 MAG: hypothetical protein A3F05_01425 [Candidatus Saccharibacteria bacterium RIFCSPHIGHO2_12_FULL_47_17]HCM52276.1 glycosyl transferase family 1 [Candidatus Saccharibacteria bacterium]
MRIAIDARESGSSTGRYIDRLVENLHRLKPEFEIVILAKPQRLDYFKKTAPDFKITECSYKEFSLGEQIGYLRQLNRLKPDLVHFGMTQQPAFYKGRAITTIHDLTAARFDNPAKNRLIFKFKQALYRWLINKVAKKSQKLITLSEFVKNDVAQYVGIDPEKISVIYEAADKIEVSAEPIAELTEQKFIMYVGRPNPHKNLNRLIDAFAKIVTGHPDLKLVLAGQPDKNYELLQKYVESKNQAGQAELAEGERSPARDENRLGARILFLGFVSDGQLRWLYENTAAYVFPSLSEGFGLPGLEAMVHGAPVASSNATCLPEIYGDGAHYFDPLNTDDMVAKINEVLDNFQLSTNLIARGKKQAAQYSWAKTAAQTLEVYREEYSVQNRSLIV